MPLAISASLELNPKLQYFEWRQQVLSSARKIGTHIWPSGLLHFVATDAEWLDYAGLDALGAPVPRLVPMPAPAFPDPAAAAIIYTRFNSQKLEFKERQLMYIAFEANFNDSLGPTIRQSLRNALSGIYELTCIQASAEIFEAYGALDDVDIEGLKTELTNPLTSVARAPIMAFFKTFDSNIASLTRSGVLLPQYEIFQSVIAAISSQAPVLEATHDFIKANPLRANQLYATLKAHIVAQIPNFSSQKFIMAAVRESISSAAIHAVPPPARSFKTPVITSTAKPPANQFYCWMHGYGKITTPGAHRGRDCPDMRAAGLAIYPLKFVNSNKHSYGVPGESGCSTVY
jgi:hypothetical protein